MFRVLCVIYVFKCKDTLIFITKYFRFFYPKNGIAALVIIVTRILLTGNKQNRNKSSGYGKMNPCRFLKKTWTINALFINYCTTYAYGYTALTTLETR